MLRWRDYKYVAHLDDTHELYDLHQDPYELKNRINDPALADVARQLRERIIAWMDDHDDDAPDAQTLRQQLRS